MAFGCCCVGFIWAIPKEAMRRGNTAVNLRELPRRPCPVCGKKIGVVAGSRDAVCKNCGFKDPCCE